MPPSKTTIKLLVHLLKEEESTIRQAAKAIKADYRIVHTTARALIKKGILAERTIGHASLLSISPKLSDELLLAERQRKEGLPRSIHAGILTKNLCNNIRSAGFVALVFGSYAKGTQTKTSDIDLMVVIPDRKHESEARLAVRMLPLPIHLQVFTEEEFVQGVMTKKFNVVHEAVKHHVILYGVEQYHELIQWDKIGWP